MSIESEFMISIVGSKCSILEINEKQTIFNKKNIAAPYEDKLREAIHKDDSTLLKEIIVELMLVAQQTGFDKASGFYMMKHLGYMFGRGLITKSGIKSDLTFVCRTKCSLK